MLNFSIMTLNEDFLDEYCQDIAYQVKNGIATMPLFMMTLTPEGDPVIDKADIYCQKYEKYKKKLDAMGVPSGVLIQATIGHGWKLNQQAPFQKYVGLTDGSSPEVYCPLDHNFQSYVRAAGARIASTRPAHIMLDDDFRLMGARLQRGCACPLHMARFSELAGRCVSREELWTTLSKNNDETARFREIFIQTQIDSLIECATELRRGIDSVDPTIPGSFCLCGGKSAEGAYEIASIMAGAKNPVIVRLNNANYCQSDPRSIVKNSLYSAAVTIAALKERPDVILAETDTYPQNRYSTPASKLHSHLSFSILEGMSGAKHWITRLHSYEPNSGKAYRQKLSAYHGFYRELERIAPELDWLGCNVMIPQGPLYELTSQDVTASKSNTWISPILDRLGLPVYFSNRSENACFFGGMSEEWFTDEQWFELLSGKVILDAPAAKELIRRGFGEYLGVDVRTRNANDKNASGEIIYPDRHSPAMYQAYELCPLSDAVKRYSDVYYLRDGTDREILFPGVTSYQNKLGGTVVVFSGVTNVPYHAPAAFGFLNETRKAQFVKILKDLNCLPIYYPDDAEVFVKAARTQDGKLFCAILNMGLDAIENLPLTTDKSIHSIKRLLPNGSYEDVPFCLENNRVQLSLTAYPFEPVVVLLN